MQPPSKCLWSGIGDGFVTFSARLRWLVISTSYWYSVVTRALKCTAVTWEQQRVVDLLSTYLTSTFTTNTVTNWTDGAWALVYSMDRQTDWQMNGLQHCFTYRSLHAGVTQANNDVRQYGRHSGPTLSFSKTRIVNQSRDAMFTYRTPTCHALLGVQRVYLLTPIDRATLPHPKSTISHYTPSVITRQHGLRAILKHPYRHLSVISTHVYMVRLKLHLVDMLSTYFTRTFAANTLTNRTDGAWDLVYSIIGVYRRRCKQQRSTGDVIVFM